MKLALKKAYGFKSYTQWKSPYITNSESFLNQIRPTAFADEAKILGSVRFLGFYQPRRILCLGQFDDFKSHPVGFLFSSQTP